MPISRSSGGWGPPAAATPVTGLEWDGNQETNTQRVLRFLSPFAMYDSTYIFRVYPKGPKTGTNPKYWTTFFWGNYGTFDSATNFFGAHPYPFDGNTADTGQNWEISIILHVSLNTIKFHLKNVYQKLGGVENRWAAVAQWQSSATGLLVPPAPRHHSKVSITPGMPPPPSESPAPSHLVR